MLWFKQPKKSRKRHAVDTIRVVKIVKKTVRHPIFNFCLITVLLSFSLLLSFYGTIALVNIKNSAGMLGLVKNGRYLVVFQNNAELRPTGGFIGSFATVSFRDYKVEKIDFNTNIYKIDNAFIQKEQIVPPKPLAEISRNRWSLHDANFSPSFPQSAQDLQWFYKNETGEEVDGVMAINASIIQDLLRHTGPIYLEKYDLKVTADNFYKELAQKIEKEYFFDSENLIENEPKTILKDLMPVLMEKTVKLKKTQLIAILWNAFSTKQILLQSNDSSIEKSILDANWGGNLNNADNDYLTINNANITDLKKDTLGGAKTSLSVRESVDYSVAKDSGFIANLTLTRTHTGSYDWPDGVNMNWTRILVPKGSSLVTAELNGEDIFKDVEVGEESGKTYFGLWINTAPQETNVLKLTYSLNIPSSNYSLLFQTQPGALPDELGVSYNGQNLYKGMAKKDLVIK